MTNANTAAFLYQEGFTDGYADGREGQERYDVDQEGVAPEYRDGYLDGFDQAREDWPQRPTIAQVVAPLLDRRPSMPSFNDGIIRGNGGGYFSID